MVNLMKPQLKVILALSLLSLAACKSEDTTQAQIKQTDEKKPPNFIVIFTDDQGYQDVGAFGGDHVYTPNLDQMAQEGMLLTDFYVAAPLCTPSRAALMTASYPRRIDMAVGSEFPVLLAGDRKGLNPTEVTIAEVLKSSGYATGMFGKWHLGDQPQFMPTKQGFDEFFGLPYSHDIAPTHKRQAYFQFPDLPLLEGEQVIEVNPDPSLLTRRFTDKAIDFINRNQHNPFFVYLPFPMPHMPLHVSEAFLKTIDEDKKQLLGITDEDIEARNKKAMYPLVIAELDQAIGQIIDRLEQLDLASNTIVIFTSDNGPSGHNHSDGSKRLLAGRKTLTLEGGQREPAIVWGPGHIPSGSSSAELTTAMDILPTLAHLAGARLPQDKVIDGKNIWPILSGQDNAKSPHQAFYFYKQNTLEAVRSGDYKLAIQGKRPGLYNLKIDPGETQDLSAQLPKKVDELKALIQNFEAELGIDPSGQCTHCRPAGYVKQPEVLSLTH